MNYLAIILTFFIGAFFGYIALGILTDIRIDKLRPFIAQGAIETAVDHALKSYQKEYIKNESLYLRKLKKRDAVIKKYLSNLEGVLNE